jgi:hypothetical protein
MVMATLGFKARMQYRVELVSLGLWLELDFWFFLN